MKTEKLRHPDFPKVHIFKHNNGKSRYWYCGFYHKKKMVKTSTRCLELSTAYKFAEKFYLTKRNEIITGSFIPTSRYTFKRATGLVEQDMKIKGNSPRYIQEMTKLVQPDTYIGRFWGGLSVESITSRTWDDYKKWLRKQTDDQGLEPHHQKTIHQFKVAVQRVLKSAYLAKWIKDVPKFQDVDKPLGHDSTPRMSFNEDELRKLYKASRKNIALKKSENKKRYAQALELHDFIVWMANTGMRPGEAMQLRFKDIRILKKVERHCIYGEERDYDVCMTTIIGGKRGQHPECRSWVFAPGAYKRRIAARGIKNPETSEEKLFLESHRNMFRNLLEAEGLYKDNYDRKRDFVSLRATYINFQLDFGANVWNIATNTRTSVGVIEKHYAKYRRSANTINRFKRIPEDEEDWENSSIFT